jgi:hypothetical protein
MQFSQGKEAKDAKDAKEGGGKVRVTGIRFETNYSFISHYCYLTWNWETD